VAFNADAIVLRHANLRARLTLAPSKMRHAVSTSQPSTNPVKFAEPRPFSDPEAAVRKLIEIANTAEPVQDARIYIERVNGPFLAAGGSPAEYRAGIERAIAKGWLWRHESGTYVKFTDAGAELLGLAFGCIDLIVTPEGEHIFLEVNEMGQFLWVEQDEPRSELLRCFATLLLNQRLGPSTRLVGDERSPGRRAKSWSTPARSTTALTPHRRRICRPGSSR